MDSTLQSTLVKPGGGKASQGGEASPSVKPTSPLTCDTDISPPSLFKVHLLRLGLLACIKQMAIAQ